MKSPEGSHSANLNHPIVFWLVVWILPLLKIWVRQLGWLKFPTEWKKQTLFPNHQIWKPGKVWGANMNPTCPINITWIKTTGGLPANGLELRSFWLEMAFSFREPVFVKLSMEFRLPTLVGSSIHMGVCLLPQKSSCHSSLTSHWFWPVLSTSF